MIKLKKQTLILVPAYMRNFSCIGSDCEDSCCIGWNIGIDRNTYKKYKNSIDFDSSLKEKVKKHIKRIRSNVTDDNYAKIELASDNNCPFLSNEKLCEIQLKFGENHLSNICSTYPRVFNIVDGIIEKSAVVSCPEAARLLLLNPEGIEFDEKEEESEQFKLISKNINTQSPSFNNKPERYLWDLRIFTIGLIQNRAYSLPDRLIILGMFYLDVQDTISQGTLEKIPILIEEFKQTISTGELREPLSEVPVLFDIQMQYLKLLTETIVKKDNKRYLDCYNEFISGLEYTKNADIEKIVANYNEAFKEYYLPFMNNHEYILENYLVNYVFNSVFPFSKYPSVYDEYIMLIIHYALIKFHMIGMARYHKGLTEDLAVKLIQSFAKNFEHNIPILKILLNLMKKLDHTKMSDMMILIKN